MKRDLSTKPSVVDYLQEIMTTPLIVWWGAATFAIEIIGFTLVSETISVPRPWLIVMIFVVSLGLFLPLVILYKGWFMYIASLDQILLKDVIRVENRQVFLLHSAQHLSEGRLLELRRKIENAEVPIGLISVHQHNESGAIQAEPVWIAPAHLNEIEKHEVSPRSLMVSSHIPIGIASRWVEGEAEAKVRELLRKGTGQ